MSRILKHGLLQLVFLLCGFLADARTNPSKFVSALKRMGFGLPRPRVVPITRTAGARGEEPCLPPSHHTLRAALGRDLTEETGDE